MHWILTGYKLVMGLPWWAQVAFFIIAFPLAIYTLVFGFMLGYTIRFLTESVNRVFEAEEDAREWAE